MASYFLNYLFASDMMHIQFFCLIYLFWIYILLYNKILILVSRKFAINLEIAKMHE